MFHSISRWQVFSWGTSASESLALQKYVSRETIPLACSIFRCFTAVLFLCETSLWKLFHVKPFRPLGYCLVF
jgi:hypothetical protein